MVKQYKVDAVSELLTRLKERNSFILTNYSGVKVKSLSVLRNKLREKDAEYKIVKNSLFKRALDQAGFGDISEYLKGPIGVAFVGKEVGEVAKILKTFGTEQQEFSYSIGVIDNVVYQAEQVKKIADLPSREVLLSQIMSLINGPATGVALGMNNIMASLARGIKAVAEKNNG
jgi:large subunit ribosomal protein L10